MALQNRSLAKLLGDAGEHYALAQLTFAEKFAAKMPDNWEAYDLAVESGAGLLRVSVKTRSETEKWSSSKWFTFDDRKVCDWLVLIFKPRSGQLRSWVLPFGIAISAANVPGKDRQDPWLRELSWRKLTTLPLSAYEENWSMNPKP